MTDDQQFRRWDKSLDAIYRDVKNLVIGRYVYEEVRKIVLANPRLHKPSSFYDLSAMTFAAWAAMAVRRQRDIRSNSIVKLLDETEKHPGVLSRERFIDTFASKMLAGSAGHSAQHSAHEEPTGRGACVPSRTKVESMAHKEFDRLVGSCASRVKPKKVHEDLEELRSKAEKLERFANQKIAHLVGEPTQPPTMPELDACISAFEEVVLRYMRLFRAEAPSELLPAWQYDWKAIFRERWL